MLKISRERRSSVGDARWPSISWYAHGRAGPGNLDCRDTLRLKRARGSERLKQGGHIHTLHHNSNRPLPLAHPRYRYTGLVMRRYISNSDREENITKRSALALSRLALAATYKPGVSSTEPRLTTYGVRT